MFLLFFKISNSAKVINYTFIIACFYFPHKSIIYHPRSRFKNDFGLKIWAFPELFSRIVPEKYNYLFLQHNGFI
jgi:hypothetical protein